MHSTRRQALGIEAPSMARCGEFDLHQACGLLSADIVRRALKFTAAEAEFRLFIHDDHTDLESGLAKMRELYLKGHQTPKGIQPAQFGGPPPRVFGRPMALVSSRARRPRIGVRL